MSIFKDAMNQYINDDEFPIFYYNNISHKYHKRETNGVLSMMVDGEWIPYKGGVLETNKQSKISSIYTKTTLEDMFLECID